MEFYKASWFVGYNNSFKWWFFRFLMEDYDKLVEKISTLSGVSLEEINKKVEAKKSKLSGLISKVGAAQIVAAELGISFEGESYKIKDLTDGMKRVSVLGQITRIFPVREFNKNGREGKVVSLLLGDETGNLRVALWDVNHISLIEKGDLKDGDFIEISGANCKNGELHLSGFSDIKKSKEKIENVQAKSVLRAGNISEAKSGDNLKVRAVIVQNFEPRYFDSKKNEGEKGVLLNLVLDDGSETIRAVMFGESIKKIVDVNDEELFSLESFNSSAKDLLGEERYFIGNFRINSYTNTLEMTINDVQDVDTDELVKELESKAS